MHDIAMNSHWGVQLEGSNQDLLKVRRFLNGSVRAADAHCVRIYGDVPMLCTSRWDDIPAAEYVYRAAASDLVMIRAMIDLLEGCGRLECGTVYEFETDTNVQLTRFTSLQVAIANGPERPADDYGLMLAKVRAQPDFEPVLAMLRSDMTWPEIYLAYEALKEACGKEKGLRRIFPGEADAIERLRRTANEHRHFDVKAKIPDPMTYDEAVRYLKDLIRRAVDRIQSDHYDGASNLKVAFYEYDMPLGGPTHLENLSLSESLYGKISFEQR